MNHDLHHALHRCRAEQLQHDAAVAVAVRRLRRARRLELAARWIGTWAATSARLANRLEARAHAGRTRAL